MSRLRPRVEDFPMLAAHFVRKYAERMAKRIECITSDAMEALVRHPWPGNIRELQNFIERAVILTNGDLLQLLALPSNAALLRDPLTPAIAHPAPPLHPLPHATLGD